jgi:hypothetical protein
VNVLLITYSFPPAAGVGVLRAHSLAKYFPENGIHVEVLTARNAAAVGRDASLLTQLAPEVAIHRTWTLDLPFALRKAIKKAVSRGLKPQRLNQQPATGNLQPATAPNPLKRLLANLLLPDPQIGWLPFALPAARRLIRTRAIDLVLITVPPFSSVRLATRLRRYFPTLPIVLDFRDEWLTSTLRLVSFNANQRARAIAQRAESEAVRDATAVVCASEAAASELRSRYPAEPAAKFHCIPNGYDTPPPTSSTELSFRPEASQSEAVVEKPATSPTPTTDLSFLPERSATEKPATPPAATLTYIGTLYPSTDPTPVVEAILTLPAELRARLHVRFVGHIEVPAYRSTLMRLADPQTGVTLELIPFLPQAQALAYIARTDYLLLITHDPINIAAKLYDYLGSGRPILAAVHPTGDVRRILEQTRAGWSADINNPAQIADLFAESLTRTSNLAQHFHPDAQAISAFHRRPLAARYAALLRDIAREPNP